jgi:inner membrane protein
VDPIAHTFTGAALAAAGLRRVTPLATTALVLGANAPDVDALLIFAGDQLALAHRRGWTHGVLAIAVWPFVLTGLLLLWDRWVRLRRRPDAAPARAGPLLALSALAVLTHPTLDWLNNYGMRWLMPFDGQWFYGDALFIIDPWVWLGLGGVLFLAHSRRVEHFAAWGAFWVLASFLVLTNGQAPDAARLLWGGGMLVLLTARALGFSGRDRRATVERAAQAALVLMAAYMTANVAANGPARAEVLADLESRGIHGVSRVMVGPMPGNPFAGTVIAEVEERYYLGQWNWRAEPRFALLDETLPRMPADPIVEAAAEAPQARRFLTWSRFPYVEVEADAQGYVVRFFDARYRAAFGLIGGPAVRVDRNLGDVQALRE